MTFFERASQLAQMGFERVRVHESLVKAAGDFDAAFDALSQAG